MEGIIVYGEFKFTQFAWFISCSSKKLVRSISYDSLHGRFFSWRGCASRGGDLRYDIISRCRATATHANAPATHIDYNYTQVVRDEVASHDNTWNCFITSIFRLPFLILYCHLRHQVGWPPFSSIMLSPRCGSLPVSQCLGRLNAPRQWIPASSQVRLKEIYPDLTLDSHWLLLSPKWAQAKSFAVQAPKERIAKFKGTKGSNVGHIHPAVSIACTASFNRNFTKDARRPY